MAQKFSKLIGCVGVLAIVSSAVAESSSLLYSNTFEGGALTWADSGNAPVVQQKIVRAGNYAMKSYLSAGPDPVATPVNFRTEVTMGYGRNANMGEEYWYGFSLYLASPFPADALQEVIAQWHNIPDDSDPVGESGGSPNLALRLEGGQWRISIAYNLSQPTTVANMVQTNAYLGPYEVDKWHDWVFHVKWAKDTSGFVEAWRNGKKVFEKRNTPTVFNDAEGPYFKMGMYKSAWKYSVTPGISVRTIYHDEFRMAGANGSYEAVAPDGGVPAPMPPTAIAVE